MKLSPFKTDFSQFFCHNGGRTEIPGLVKVVIGEVTVETNGLMLAQHSEVLCEMITKTNEIYIDQFTGYSEDVVECLELLYGREVTPTQANIQIFMKFALVFKVAGMYEVCVEWVRKELNLINLQQFFKLGMFVKHTEDDLEELLEACKAVINQGQPAELLEHSTGWADDAELFQFLFSEEILLKALPILTAWVDNDVKVCSVLDRITEKDLFGTIYKGDKAMVTLMTDEMREHCSTFLTATKLLNFQSKIIETSTQNMGEEDGVSDFLRNQAWRQLNKQELTLARSSLQLNDFVFAEILEAWTRHTMPTKEDFLDLWSLIRQAELPYNFRNLLSNLFDRIDVRFHVPELNVDVEVVRGDCIHASVNHSLTYRDLQSLIDNRLISFPMDGCCRFQGCDAPATSTYTMVLQLRDTFPCFDLSPREDTETEHYHGEKQRHVYIDNNDMTSVVYVSISSLETVTRNLQICINRAEEEDDDFNLDDEVFELNQIFFKQ